MNVPFLFRYDPKTDQWCADVPATSSSRTSVGVAVLDSALYAIGGQDGVSCLSIVERYDPIANKVRIHLLIPLSTICS